MIDTNVIVDNESQLFETPRKKSHSLTVPIAQILLGSASLQYQHNNKTHRPNKKLPPPRKEYLCFQTDGKTSWSEQCAKSSTLTKAID